MADQDDLMERMRKLADLCVGEDAKKLRDAANELQAAIENDSAPPGLLGAWARARRIHEEVYIRRFGP